MENTNTSSRTRLILGILGLIVIVSVALRLTSLGNKKNPNFSSENIKTTSVDLATAQGEGKLPAAFPKDTPIEVANITESTTLSYPDRKVNLYNVAYFSLKQEEELFSIYGTYLKKNGYSISLTDKSANRMVYQAKKGNTDLSVVIVPQQGRMNVLVSYVVRE